MTTDRNASAFSEQDPGDEPIAAGTAVTTHRAEALGRAMEKGETSDDDHAVLGGLARELNEELDARIAENPDDRTLTDVRETLGIIQEIHERPTPWTGRGDEPETFGAALDALGKYDEAYAAEPVRELAAQLRGRPEQRHQEAWATLETMEPEDRRETFLGGETYGPLTQFAIADNALTAATAQEAGPARLTTFKQAAGFDPEQTDDAVLALARTDASRTEQRAERLARELDARDVTVSIGREDPGADYTIMTAAGLMGKTHQALMNQENDNEDMLDRLISRGNTGGALMIDGVGRENDLADTQIHVSRNLAEADADAAKAQMDAIEEFLRSDPTEAELKERLAEMMQAQRAEEHPALDTMAALDDRAQVDLESISAEDEERGASRYNNRPPRYDPATSFDEQAESIRAYIEPRLARLESDRSGRRHGTPDSDVQAAAEFGEAISRPYRTGENATQNAILAQMEQDVGNTFHMNAIAEQSSHDCAESVLRLMRAQHDLAGYEPGQNAGSAGETFGSADLRQTAETGVIDQDAMFRAFSGVAETGRLDAWLQSNGDPRALNRQQQLHLRAIEGTILKSDSDEPDAARENAGKAVELIETFDMPEWAQPGTDAHDDLTDRIDAARREELQRYIDRIAGQNDGA